MKINCEKCQAKYSIADEKVRGKTFKIRCKKCGHVIIVRDKGAAASDAAAPAVAEAAGWHVAVGGETVGPLTEQDIRARIEQGEYRQDASVWRDGFEDWVPMHTVDVFGSVLERVGVHGRGGGAESGTGGASAGLGGSFSDDIGPADGGSPASPRVQSLTGQRNENSVLFSLDSLQKVGSGAQATSSPSQSGAAAATLSPGLSPQIEPLSGPGGTFTPSTAAPTSEGSGLIDIRAMSAVLTQASAQPMRDESVLPSFGGSGLGGLSAQPVAKDEPLPEVEDHGMAAPVAQPRSNVGLVLAATLGSVGLALGLGYFFVVKPMMAQGADAADQQVKLARAEERAKFAQKELEREREEREAAAKEAQAEADAEKNAPPDAGSGPAAAVAAATAKDGGAKRSGNHRRRSGGVKRPAAGQGGGSKAGSASANTKPSAAAGAAAKKPAAKAGGGDDSNIDVDCLLDPDLPKCKKSGGRKAARKKSGGAAAAKPAVDSNLPKSLTQSQLLGGLRSAKGRAKSCGKKHGGAPGTRVRVRMSISGSTGKVTSAVPQGEHASSALGKCVAAAASKASFPKFQKTSQGLQYNFKM